MISKLNSAYCAQADLQNQRKQVNKQTTSLLNKPQYDVVCLSKVNKNNNFFNSLISFTSAISNKLKIAPTVAVVDSFNQKCIDIDGDGIDDISHGKAVCSVIKAQIPDVKLKTYRVKSDATGAIENASIINHLNSIAKAVKSGEKIDGVNISIGSSLSFNQMSMLLGEKVNQKNIATKKEPILKMIENFDLPEPKKAVLNMLMPGYLEGTKQFFDETKEYLAAVKELVSLKVPVNIAAGNDGNKYFDPICFVDGINNVGATNAKGQIADFSCKNELVNTYAQGVFNISKITSEDGKLKGYDITGTGKPEVLARDVSGSLEENLVEMFDGRPAAEVLATPKQQKLYEQLESFGDSEDLYKFVQSRKNLEKDLAEMQDKLFVCDVKRGQPLLTDFTNAFTFKIDNKTGNILYSPDKSKRKAVNVLEGTSFSSPLDLAKRVKAKFIENSK